MKDESSDEFEQEMEKVATQLLRQATRNSYSKLEESVQHDTTKVGSKKSVRFMGLEEPRDRDEDTSRPELLPNSELECKPVQDRNRDFYDPVYFDSSDEEGRSLKL